MKDLIEEVAARRGWNDAATATALKAVLQSLVDTGAVNDGTLRALLRRHGIPTADGPPAVGDMVEIEGGEIPITVVQVPDEQPDASYDAFVIVDLEGATYTVRRDDDDVWVAMPIGD